MEIELLEILKEDSALTALVGPRIEWGTKAQGSGYPAIVLNVVSDAEGYHMNGPNNLYQGRVQVDAYGLEYGATKAVSKAVVAVLHCYRGKGFRLITHVSTRDSREGGTNEAERPFRVGLDFTTAWKEMT